MCVILYYYNNTCFYFIQNSNYRTILRHLLNYNKYILTNFNLKIEYLFYIIFEISNRSITKKVNSNKNISYKNMI